MHRLAAVIVGLALATSHPVAMQSCCAADSIGEPRMAIPRDLQSYADGDMEIADQLAQRIESDPFNLIATIIFALAIGHSFLAARFRVVSLALQRSHSARIARGEARLHSVSHAGRLFGFLGEVEVIFGLWCIPLLIAMVLRFDWTTAVDYVSERCDYTEAMFVVVIMTLASTRPILKLSEGIIGSIATRFGGSLSAWWFTILTVGPLLGSVITEAAAMTISAHLLLRKLFPLEPSRNLKYATLGLLLVNISVGGTLTHFAAPPVLMVSEAWAWDTSFMFTHFGWKAGVGILLSNALYWLLFRREFAALRWKFEVREHRERILVEYLPRERAEREAARALKRVAAENSHVDQRISSLVDRLTSETKERLREKVQHHLSDMDAEPELVMEAFDQRFEEIKLYLLQKEMPHLLPEEDRAPFIDPNWDNRREPVPVWITIVHVIFIGWTIFNAHHPVLFIAGLLFLLGFETVTADFQNHIDLKQPLLVGFFLSSLVIHGGLQGWWIAPVLGGFDELPLALVATALTSVNDNAALAYLATLVPDFSDGLKYAIIAGAVSGGGLTVIANAPNPAGQAILDKQFGDHGIAPVTLLRLALLPTAIMFAIFMLLR